MKLKYRLKAHWESVACWLPRWMVGWYWRREIRRTSEWMLNHSYDLSDVPVSFYICRKCSTTYRPAEAETHTCRSNP